MASKITTAKRGIVPMSVLLTPEEVAARLKKETSTLQSWRMRGGGPAYIKMGHRTVRYRLEDVEAWERKNQFNNTAEERQRKRK
jgi:predicted DNA-binding transcriptional regulator AlpA